MWEAFHHPQISLPVVRRKAVEQLVDLAGELLEFTRSPLGWVMRPENFSSRAAFDSAVYRLRKQGLIVGPPGNRSGTTLTFSEKLATAVPARLRPEQHWQRRWSGIWYVLTYDVPEKQKPDREALRRFVRRLRLGCLQLSVWVTPHDIRPAYADLLTAASVGSYAFLFEARTVLGQRGQAVAEAAWDFTRLGDIQRCYCTVYGANLARLRQERTTGAAVLTLGREALAAYQAAFAEDPLLPKALWPRGYLGPQVAALHRDLMREIGRRS